MLSLFIGLMPVSHGESVEHAAFGIATSDGFHNFSWSYLWTLPGFRLGIFADELYESWSQDTHEIILTLEIICAPENKESKVYSGNCKSIVCSCGILKKITHFKLTMSSQG